MEGDIERERWMDEDAQRSAEWRWIKGAGIPRSTGFRVAKPRRAEKHPRCE